MRIGSTEDAVEKLFHLQPPGQHQGLVPIMKMEPILRAEVSAENSCCFMTRGAYVEKCLPAIHQLHLHSIHPTGRKHTAIQSQGAGTILSQAVLQHLRERPREPLNRSRIPEING
jgi:hypothetical protein